MDWIERELEAAVRARPWEDDGLQVELESYRRLRTSPPTARAWRGAAPGPGVPAPGCAESTVDN
jgi:hypothetical protein